MTIHEIPNIENCTITPRLNGKMQMITANEGWYIRLNDGDEETKDVWATVMILNNNYPWEQVEIRAFESLPEPDEEISDAEALKIITEGVSEE